MDSGMFSEFKKNNAALNSDKSWFDSMNEIKTPRFDEQC
jgi:hypothetical protein